MEIIIKLLIVCLIALSYYLQNLRYKNKINKLEGLYKSSLKIEKEKAIKQSKSVIKGQVNEHLIPLFPDFPYNLSECKMSGQPIDYIVFEGMDSYRDSVAFKEPQISIIFADVKVGKAQKTKVQNGIKKAVEEGRVRFETWNITENNKIDIK